MDLWPAGTHPDAFSVDKMSLIQPTLNKNDFVPGARRFTAVREAAFGIGIAEGNRGVNALIFVQT